MKRWIVFAGAVLALATPVHAKSILFVGNSFTFGAGSPVLRYRADAVTDLNGDGIGGVPALFRTFAEQLKLDWKVSLETSPGKDLAWHLAERRGVIAGKWDVVLLQGYSTLDRERPGDPTRHLAAAGTLADLFRAANPAVSVRLVSTWSRADLTWQPSGQWYGQGIDRMAADLARANCSARHPALGAPISVGAAWSRAMRAGVADPNPYDGIAKGQVDLWAADHYHASAAGSYLKALVVFGAVTGTDPRRLGKHERAARELGLSPKLTGALQRIAAQELKQIPCG
ncbi:MAG: hypothetical protein RL299_1489 [Pseudomonadota bacterium]|jgi:hypothetical protein